MAPVQLSAFSLKISISLQMWGIPEFLKSNLLANFNKLQGITNLMMIYKGTELKRKGGGFTETKDGIQRKIGKCMGLAELSRVICQYLEQLGTTNIRRRSGGI